MERSKYDGSSGAAKKTIAHRAAPASIIVTFCKELPHWRSVVLQKAQDASGRKKVCNGGVDRLKDVQDVDRGLASGVVNGLGCVKQCLEFRWSFRVVPETTEELCVVMKEFFVIVAEAGNGLPLPVANLRSALRLVDLQVKRPLQLFAFRKGEKVKVRLCSPLDLCERDIKRNLVISFFRDVFLKLSDSDHARYDSKVARI